MDGIASELPLTTWSLENAEKPFQVISSSFMEEHFLESPGSQVGWRRSPRFSTDGRLLSTRLGGSDDIEFMYRLVGCDAGGAVADC